MERKISEKGYTLRELILAVREEYLKELSKLEELGSLVKPVSRRVEKIEFKFSGGLKTTELKCDVIKKINKLDELLKRTDRVILTSFEYEPHRMIPYIRKDIDRFENLKDEIMGGDYVNHMNNVSCFETPIDEYLLQTNAEEILLTRKGNKYHGPQHIVFRDGDSLYLSDNTEIADVYNMLNVDIPENALTDYQKTIMNKVENPFALRVVDARKADEINDTKSIVVLAKRK